LLSYILGKTLNALLTFVVVVMLTFAIPRLVPGSPVDILACGYRLPEEASELLTRRFGLDQPLHVQFLAFVQNVALRFPPDFGYSYFFFPATAWEVIAMYLPWTIFLLFLSILLSAIFGSVVGIYIAWKRGSMIEPVILGLSILSFSTPYFWTAIMLVLIFGVWLRLFPIIGAFSPEVLGRPLDFVYIMDVLKHATLPVLSLVIFNFPVYAIIMRGNMVSVFSEDYVVTAKAKGLKERTVLFRHVARNAVLPVFTTFMLHLGRIVGGAILTEIVFSYPGVGLLIFNAVIEKDYPVIQGFFYILSVTVIAANYIADLLYTALDPRVRY